MLTRAVESARFTRVTTFSPRNVLHEFILSSVADVDAEFSAYLLEAYRVGEQRHLAKPRSEPSARSSTTSG